MFFKKLKSLFKRKPKPVEAKEGIVINHPNSISFWTAGIKFESRLDNLLTCRIKDQVLLIREPDNPIDKNAIHVTTMNGSSLGYVGKNRATLLAPMFDTNKIDGVGYIVELKSDLKNELYGVKVCLPVSEEALSIVKSDKLKEIEFVFERSPRDNLYILLNCEENVLDEVKNILEGGGVIVDRAGISYAVSGAGKMYNWYIRINNGSDRVLIERLLRDNFPLLKEKYDNQFNEEYLELQDEELHNLQVQRDVFETKINELEKSLENLLKREALYNEQFEKMTKIFLSDVIFVRDSIDVLKKEIEDYTTALNKIHALYSDPLMRGKKIHTLEKWFEIHFNTGAKDDGRIYFKREGSKLNVLVSLKSSQKKDIEYLRS